MMISQRTKKLLDAEDVMELLGVSRPTLGKYIRRFGLTPLRRYRPALVFRRQEVLAWLRTMRRRASEKKWPLKIASREDDGKGVSA